MEEAEFEQITIHTNFQLQTVTKWMKKRKGSKRPRDTKEGITFLLRLEEWVEISQEER